MSFELRRLAAGASHESGGFSPVMFTYRSTSDNLAAIAASGYFDEAQGLITTGDAVLIDATDGSRLSRLVNTAGVITTVTIA